MSREAITGKAIGAAFAPSADSAIPKALKNTAQWETPKVFDTPIEAFVKANRRAVAHLAMGAYLPAVQTLMS